MTHMVPVYSCRSIPVLDTLIRQAGPCPRCRANNESLGLVRHQEMPSLYALKCTYCERRGQPAFGLEGAVRGWNYH